MTNPYIMKTLMEFMYEHKDAQQIDLTGVYGPQSTDLATLYISELIGNKWQWGGGHARDLLQLGNLRQWFMEVTPGQLRPGDVVALLGADTSAFGTVGIFLGFSPDGTQARVFTQTPMQPTTTLFDAASLLGGLRYVFDAQWSSLNVSERQQRRELHTTTPAEPQLIGSKAAALTHPAEPRATLASWMMIADDDSHYGRECVKAYDEYAARHASKRSLWRRFWDRMTR
ncbi:endolysin [Arthrobacter phage Sicarius2]|uniref:Endolysin n=1 Tax=Arthrobacter phage Sicarius2 TaxID=2836090 RepID=A0A8F3E6E8_9CAUD|nr:endolysin [Arthrobacter phage Sicarius2]